jgi:hypothetical protein
MPGKRKSNAKTYRDAMAMARLVDVDGMQVEDAARQLGLTRSTGYRLLSRARSMLLAPQVEADRKAAEPVVKEWFEPNPARIKNGFIPSRPDPVVEENVVGVTDDVGDLEAVGARAEQDVRRPEQEMKLLPIEQPRRAPKPPPDTSEAGRRREWRRQQVEKQMEENGHQLTFRGRQKSSWEKEDDLEF